MDKVNSIFPLPSEWIGNFKEGWYRDNNISSKKELDEIWQERVRTIDQIYKYQRIAFEKKFAEWQQSQQPEPIEDIELEKYIFIPVQDFIDTVKITEGEIKRYKDWLEKEPDNVKFQLMKIAYEEKLKFINHLFESFKTQQGNNLPEQQGWISVDTRNFPDFGQRVLVIDANNGSYFIGYRNKSSQWMLDTLFDIHSPMIDITHWRHLQPIPDMTNPILKPAPPKK